MIQIDLEPQVEAELRARASEQHLSLEEYVAGVLASIPSSAPPQEPAPNKKKKVVAGE